MDGNPEKSGSWSWFWDLLILTFVVGLLIAIAKPNYIGNGRTKVSDIINILRIIDSANTYWASEHGITNAAQFLQSHKPLTETDIAPIMAGHNVNFGFNRDGTLQPIAGEIYTIGGVNIPPEAKLTRKLKFGDKTLPKGTIIQLATDPSNGFPFQIVLPNQKN